MRSNMIPVVQQTSRSQITYYPDLLRSTYLNLELYLDFTTTEPLPSEYVAYPELYSAKLYGTTDYWWILCMVNNVVDPLLDMRAGDIWRIPSYASIQRVLASGNVSKVGTAVTI